MVKRKAEQPKIAKSNKSNDASSNPKKSKLEKPNKPTNTLNTKPKFSKFPSKDGKKISGMESTEPTDWVKLKQEKKDLKIARKKKNNFYDVIIEAKKIGELLRRKNLKGGIEERNNLITELHKILGNKGQYVKLVVAHDMARVIQYLFKFGNEEIRREVSKELIPATVELIQSKYAKFTVERMLKYGNTETRKEVIDACLGHIIKITCHSTASHVLANAYATWATPQQKQYMQQEFYGDMYKQSKDSKVHCIADAYQNSPDMKAAILGSVKANLQKVITKGLLDNQLVHAVLADYLTADIDAQQHGEMISSMTSHAVVLANSKDGAKVVMKCIWNGTNKDKKTVLKGLKEHIKDLCCHEHAHTCVLAVLDAVDDTVLVNKVLVPEIVAHSTHLAQDEWGRKVLLWLVAPVDPCHFHPTLIQQLKAGYTSGTSKKSPEIRRRELVTSAIPHILTQLKDEPETWVANSSVGMVTLAILKSVECNTADAALQQLQSDALKSICEFITNPEWRLPEDQQKSKKDAEEKEVKEIAGCEHAGLHMIFKKLAQHDKEILANQERVIKTFGEVLVDSISEECVKEWLKTNRGSFLLVHIFEANSQEVQDRIKELVKPNVKSLKKPTTGCTVLLKKIT